VVTREVTANASPSKSAQLEQATLGRSFDDVGQHPEVVAAVWGRWERRSRRGRSYFEMGHRMVRAIVAGQTWTSPLQPLDWSGDAPI
jgi:hypothetical protein